MPRARKTSGRFIVLLHVGVADFVASDRASAITATVTNVTCGSVVDLLDGARAQLGKGDT
jgi:hypothetical protein